MVEHVNNDNLKSYYSETNKKVVVRFYSNWSGLCNAIEPYYHRFAQDQHNTITFLDVDVSHNLKSTAAVGAFSLPFIAVYEAGELTEKLSDSNLVQLQAFLRKQTETLS